MKTLIVVLILSFSGFAFAGTHYYIDDVAGKDSNKGNTPATAWKTIEKVNQTVLKPGDRGLAGYHS